MGRLTVDIMGWRPIPFNPQGVFLCMCSEEDLFDLKNKKFVFSYLLPKQEPAPPCSCHHFCLGGSVHREKFPAAQLGPIYLPPHYE